MRVVRAHRDLEIGDWVKLKGQRRIWKLVDMTDGFNGLQVRDAHGVTQWVDLADIAGAR